MIHRLIAGTAIVAAGLGFAAVGTAATASALTGDKGVSDNSAFFTQIDQAGIGYDSQTAAIKNAQQVCTLLGNGRSASSISSELQSNTNLSNRQANAFVTASVNNFCPSYAASI